MGSPRVVVALPWMLTANCATLARMDVWIGDAACVVVPAPVEKGCFLMVVSPTLLGMVPEWALFGAGWLAVGVFLMVSLTCYAYRRVVAVPGDGYSRVDDVLASVLAGVVCALVSASLVVGVGVFM